MYLFALPRKKIFGVAMSQPVDIKDSRTPKSDTIGVAAGGISNSCKTKKFLCIMQSVAMVTIEQGCEVKDNYKGVKTNTIVQYFSNLYVN